MSQICKTTNSIPILKGKKVKMKAYEGVEVQLHHS
jgi:hypothetical protein